MRKSHPSRLARFAARFAAAERGATAVEFALVSLPLLGLILGTLELVLVLLVSTTLETATESASRMIRTGEFQTSAANTRADFKALVCQRMSWLNAQCNSQLMVTSQVFSDFGALAGSAPINSATFIAGGPNYVNTGGCFSTGQPADIVLVRVYFTWPLFSPLLDGMMDNMGNGKRLMSSASAFRNEPYNDNLPGGAAC
ncbi:MAG TPA: TadE/TadG family type IV pilus assembly protein [Phenylobacterium sp.]|jgi:Flp pilus assembly protein TadG